MSDKNQPIKMTVKEAYKKAGYEAPAGYELYWGYHHHGGFWITAMLNPTPVNARPLYLAETSNGHYIWRETMGVEGIQISNLPAVDCIKYLPAGVRDHPEVLQCLI